MDLRKRRELLGYKQNEVARYLGISEGAYSRYEHGTRRPRPKLAKKIAKLYGISWTDFYEDEQDVG